jgi:CheY-like chemotaxis protein
LKSKGKNVIFNTPTVESCLEYLASYPDLLPDLIIMDIALEGEMDGIAATEIINKKYNIPIIFLTAYANEKLMEKLLTLSPFPN